MCDGCHRYFDQYQRTIKTLSELPPERLPDDARSALLEAFRTSREKVCNAWRVHDTAST